MTDITDGVQIQQLRAEFDAKLADTARTLAETRKLDAETRKLRGERIWYPFVVAATFLGSGSALTFVILAVAKALGLGAQVAQ